MSGKSNTKAIILGDLHFFIKQSNVSFYENTQLPFFRDQLVPYMLENDIKLIYQLGDFLDNRSTIDIKLWERLRKEIFEELIDKNGIKIISLLGNHDISLRESKEITFMKTIADMYSCIEIVEYDTIIQHDDKNILFVPWLTKNDKINISLAQQADYILGHFEIQGFQMTKGHFDEHGLDPKNFSIKKIKQVYSGHYHLKDKKGKIFYVGTPYQLTWSDFNAENGFIVFDGKHKDIFIQNEVSSRFIKLKYNDALEKQLEIKGFSNIIDTDIKEFLSNPEVPKILKNNYIKLFINKASNTKYEEIIYILKQNNVDFEIINNQEITNLINTDYISSNSFILDSTSFILDTIKGEHPDIFLLATEIMNEAKQLER